jgi:hypothetical protein
MQKFEREEMRQGRMELSKLSADNRRMHLEMAKLVKQAQQLRLQKNNSQIRSHKLR